MHREIRITSEASEARTDCKSQPNAQHQPLFSLPSLKLSSKAGERCCLSLRHHSISYPHTNKAAAASAFILVASIPMKEKLFFLNYFTFNELSSHFSFSARHRAITGGLINQTHLRIG